MFCLGDTYAMCMLMLLLFRGVSKHLCSQCENAEDAAAFSANRMVVIQFHIIGVFNEYHHSFHVKHFWKCNCTQILIILDWNDGEGMILNSSKGSIVWFLQPQALASGWEWMVKVWEGYYYPHTILQSSAHYYNPHMYYMYTTIIHTHYYCTKQLPTIIIHTQPNPTQPTH